MHEIFGTWTKIKLLGLKIKMLGQTFCLDFGTTNELLGQNMKLMG